MTATATKLSFGFGYDCEDFEFFCDTLTEELNKLNPDGYWSCVAQNFGWRKLSGFQAFQANTGEEFLRAILPRTQCAFNVFIDQDKVRIQNYHHDSPVGDEWYTAVPSTRCELCGCILDRVDDKGNLDLAPFRVIDVARADGGFSEGKICMECTRDWYQQFFEDDGTCND